ncbi:MAG: YbaB/EbfC family nucleoid-associated protein [Gemmatimonadaceae bacterium]|nr:YbaB/EbfC family nucleoid-associated protein [Gemmatimonadaceae bacterium]
MDLFKIMQQAQQMQGKLQQMQEELGKRSVTGTAGGGLVTVEADGRGAVRRVRIEPSVVQGGDVELLEDLVAAAVTDAQQKAAELAQAEMGALTGGMNLPFKLPFM